jgi:long-chain fatty acid transport protein
VSLRKFLGSWPARRTRHFHRGPSRACALIVIALLLYAPAAAASPLFELLGPLSGQGGFNARVGAPSAASAYYNPALLPRARRGLDVGTFVLHDAIAIELMARSPQNDLAESGRGKYQGGDRPALPTRWLEQGCRPDRGGTCLTPLPARPRQGAGSSGGVRPYASIGLVVPIVADYLTAGLYALVPLKVFTRGHSFFVDEREQYFSNSLHAELYGDRLDAISIALGLGSQLTEQLALGLSVTVNVGNDAQASTYVSNSAALGETLQLSNQVEVDGSVAPHGALHYQPLPWLAISATLHSPQKFEIRTTTISLLPLGDLQRAERRAVHDWQPWIVGLGGQWDLASRARQQWSLLAHVAWARWSRYQNRQGERARVDFAWSDTLSGSLGLRHALDARLRSRLDVSYVPSPVPDQVGRDNYVDSDRIGMTLGAEYDLPSTRTGLTFRIGGQAQLHVLRRRVVHKLDPSALPPLYPQLVVDEWADDQVDPTTGATYPDAIGLQTNNPGWPGFRSRGLLLGAGLTLSLLY